MPDYRVVGVTYTATFFGPFGGGISNAPVPPYLVEKFAGAKWNEQEIRQSISAIDDLVKGASSGTLQINAANMILLLQGRCICAEDPNLFLLLSALMFSSGQKQPVD